ncbi:hypothetical protein M1E17_03045 [Arthrobacter sp. D1-29]
MKARLALAGSALLIALTGCDGESIVDPTQQSSPVPTAATASSEPRSITGPGTYTFTADGGGTGTLHVPGPAASDIEELRTMVGAPPVTYISAAVDNRKGTKAINMYSLRIYTPEGRELKYAGASPYVDDLRRRLPPDTPSEVFNKFIELSDAYLDDASPLEVKNFVLVGPEVPAQITGITVYPTGGFPPVSAEPGPQ